MQKQKVFFKNKKRKKLIGVLHVPDYKEGDLLPCIIISHGLLSSKDNNVSWAERLCVDDFVVFRFDLTGHGESEGKFENTSMSHYIEDLECAINHVRALDFVDENRIGLTGHSLGGSLSMICASRDNKIKSLASISPATDFKEVFDIFNKLGFMDPVNIWKKEGSTRITFVGLSKIKYEFYKDVIKYKFDKIAKKIKCPSLIVHGEMDEIVPIHQSKNIIEHLNEPKKLVVMKDVGHNFSTPRQMDTMVQLTQTWFSQWMKEELKIH